LPVYIHERIDIDGGARGKMIELVRSRWAPHLERQHGVRLFGAWATVGSTATWPEVRLHWEMDDWAQFARAQEGQHPMEERDVYLTELWNQALDYRKHGHAALLRATAFSPDCAAVQKQGLLKGEVILHEDIRTLPGRMSAYHDALQSRYLPLAKKRGIRLLGAYSHALLPNTGLNLWALKGWDHWQELMEGEAKDRELRAWTEGQREWLEDSDAFLVVQPPLGALRT
jgi:hypothetical protein